MYLARVLVGDTCAGGSEDRAPREPRPGARGPDDLCDTGVDSVSNPQVFVTYHDAQHYPAYLLTFRNA